MQIVLKTWVHSLLLIIMGFSVLIAGCSAGSGNIVGRWELEGDPNLFTYEFNQDGTGAYFLNPYEARAFTYTFAQEGGVLTILSPEGFNVLSTVTFDSPNTISLLQSGSRKPWSYVRQPIPQGPALARARLSQALHFGGLPETYSIIEAKPVEDEELSGYQMLALTEVEIIVGVQPEQWLFNVQFDGEDQTRQFLLVRADEKWGVLQLIKNQ